MYDRQVNKSIFYYNPVKKIIPIKNIIQLHTTYNIINKKNNPHAAPQVP